MSQAAENLLKTQAVTKGEGSTAKALRILDLIAAQARPMRFSEVLELSDLPKATLYRFMQNLTELGMLKYDDATQQYALGMRLVRLAHAAWQQSSLAPIAKPHIDRLAADVGETVHLAQLDVGQVLYVYKRSASNPLEMFSQAGKVGPAYCTGVGKAILAFVDQHQRDDVLAKQSYYPFTEHTLTSPEALAAELDDIRQAGIAFDREEHEPGIICIAVPILAGKEKVVGGMSITSSVARYNLTQLESFKPKLLATSRLIGEEVASWQFPV